MLFATALLYPCVLAALCIGTGLLVERVSRWALPGALLIPLGAAGLIAVSQLSTYAYPIAPATPYLMVAVALAGYGLAPTRARALAKMVRARPLAPIVSALAYLIALAPVLLAGRPTFSSFMALSDSAVHMIGADYLISHGQHYAHLDLGNSYGQFIQNYYDTSYPSGADTLFGGSARLLGLPLIWAFQPFNAFMLAAACGPAWTIARRMRLAPALASLAALCAVLPALVYGYELFGSVKEITAVLMILMLAALAVDRRAWLGEGAVGALPFGLVTAAGVSALGVAFGAWALAATLVLGGVVVGEAVSERERWAPGVRRVAPQAGLAALALAVAAWPTWTHVSGSIQVAQNIAVTSNPGNLHTPLHPAQVFGIWLGGSYKLDPPGGALTATYVLISIALLAAVVGAVRLLRDRSFALISWFALMLLTWLLVSNTVATWAGAKALMLTSPAVVLLAWGALARPRPNPARRWAGIGAATLALLLSGGVLVSDALQYHSSNLAPTARYDELASIGTRFAGDGPTLFADFDEYSLYELRDLDVGGPDFVYPPPALAPASSGYGQPIRLARLSGAALRSYRLIVTRRDPSAARPPAAYDLVWRGTYYEVWQRNVQARPALAHVVLAGPPARRCAAIGALAAAGPFGSRLTAAPQPQTVSVSLAHLARPAGWGRERGGLAMKHPGTVTIPFVVPVGGEWQVWVRGQLMAAIELAVDGSKSTTISGQLSGNSLVPDTVGTITLRLSRGPHRLSIRRGGVTLAPGDGGSAVLAGVFLARARSASEGAPTTVSSSAWRTLCGGSYAWVELLRG